MRKIIIDTDTGSDDAVALIMALKDKGVKVEAITMVSGNCHIDQATKNALMTLEVTDTYYPNVYKGSGKPLFRELFTALNVHGEDGMGDQDLVHPTLKEQDENAITVMLDLINKYPNEIEIIAIGPMTNIAKAILLDPITMKKVKHIYSMGTSGLGQGNTTPVSEFNVYVDAESYDIFLEFDVPKTIIGFDICLGGSALHQKDLDFLLNSGNKEAIFSVKVNKTLQDYNLRNTGEVFIDLPDPVAMGVLLWEDIILEKVDTYAKTITTDNECYGQVIFYCDERTVLYDTYKNEKKNVTLIKKIDNQLFKKKLLELLVR